MEAMPMRAVARQAVAVQAVARRRRGTVDRPVAAQGALHTRDCRILAVLSKLGPSASTRRCRMSPVRRHLVADLLVHLVPIVGVRRLHRVERARALGEEVGVAVDERGVARPAAAEHVQSVQPLSDFSVASRADLDI